MSMERRMRGNFHVRCGAGEKLEITSKVYLSLLDGGHPSRHTRPLGNPNPLNFLVFLLLLKCLFTSVFCNILASLSVSGKFLAFFQKKLDKPPKICGRI